MGVDQAFCLRADDEIRTRDPHLGKVMLYQLSHIRRLRSNFSKAIAGSDTGIPERYRRAWSALVGWAEIDAEDQDAVLDRARRIADDGEVLEVDVGLAQERLTLGAGHRRQWTFLDRGGSLTEPGEHLIDIESSHGGNGTAGRTPAQVSLRLNIRSSGSMLASASVSASADSGSNSPWRTDSS